MDAVLTIGTEVDTKKFDKQIEEIEYQLKELDYELEHTKELKLDNKTIKEYNLQIEKLTNKLVDLRQKQAKYNQIINEAQSKGFEKIKKSINDIGDRLTSVTRKVGRWALAVFGVRSAYLFVRSAVNTIASQDEQLKADIDAIKVALAYTIEPLVRGIVNLMKTLMGYVAYIVYQWTGRDIFARSAKSLASAGKSAKDLKKSLAGFDKINKLSGNDESDSGGISSSIKPLEEGKEPGWLKWIGDNGDLVKGTLWGIAGALVGIKLGMSGIQATGFFVFVLSIYELAQSIIKYLQDPSWENFGKIIFWISGAIMGLGIMFGSLPLIIAGAIGLIVGIIAMFWDKIEGFLTKLQDSIYNVGDKIMNWINEKCGSIGSIINVVIGTIIGVVTSSIELVKDSIGGVFKFVKSILDSIILLFKGDFKGALKSVLKATGNLIIDMLNALGSALNVVISPIRALVVAVGKVTGQNWTMKNIKIPKIPRLAQGGIVHNPGSGVMMGSYIAGEGRNPEAVIPLDDATLDRLGQAIARHSQINATIVNEMDGRVLSKNLARVHSENAFARNGGY